MLDEQIFNNIRQSFASAVQRIYVQSIDKVLTFREATVKEHRSLAKTVISNRNSQSVIYAATLAMIKNLCLEEDFDPYSISEFDRLKIIVNLFSNNFFSKNLSIRCPRKACDGSLKYPIKYGTLLKMMDSVDCSDIVFDNENSIGKARVIANFPNTSRYLSLLQAVDERNDKNERKSPSSAASSYDSMDASFQELDATASNGGGFSKDDEAVKMIRKRREILKGKVAQSVKEKTDILGNVELKRIDSDDAMLDIADIYLKRIQIFSITGSENQFDIDMGGFDYNATEKLLSVLPMGLFVGEDGKNIVKHVAKSIFAKMNACVPKIVCPKCGYEISKRLTLQNFFIFG